MRSNNRVSQLRDNRLSVAGQEIDIVYKRLLVNEYLPIINEYPALLNAYRAGAICLVNSFRSKLIHKKALFAVLTDTRHAALFSPAELAAIRAHVPWTRRVRAGRTLRGGETIDLPEFIRKNRPSTGVDALRLRLDAVQYAVDVVGVVDELLESRDHHGGCERGVRVPVEEL